MTAGLATSWPAATGRRPSTVYSITPAGRQALAALIDDTTAKLRFGEMIAASYLEGSGPFPERLPLSGLIWRFLWEYHVTVLRWARWARDQVGAWPEDLSQVDATAEFGRIVAAASSPRAGW